MRKKHKVFFKGLSSVREAKVWLRSGNRRIIKAKMAVPVLLLFFFERVMYYAFFLFLMNSHS